MNEQKEISKLLKLNGFAGILHASQAVIMLLLATSFTLPVTIGYLRYDEQLEALVPSSKELFAMPFAWLTVSFLIMSALAHLYITTIYKKRYKSGLQKGINKARWFEYSLSASTMMIAIAMLTGIYDIGLLIAIFFLTAGMNLMGLMMELHNQTTKKVNWTSYIIGCLLGIIPWIVIGLYFWGAEQYGGGVPNFVYAIYVSIFVAFNCFAINMILQYKKAGRWRNYLFGERMYIILSLVAKSALAWQVFAGSLRP